MLNFLEFTLANKNIQNTVIFINYQQNPLETEINQKRSPRRILQNEFNRFSNDSLFRLNGVNFSHVPAIFLSSIDNVSRTHDSNYLSLTTPIKLILSYFLEALIIPNFSLGMT